MATFTGIHIGTSFRNIISQLPNKTQILVELNNIRNLLNCFHREHCAELKKIRNLIGAHRDNESYRQLEAIKELDPEYIMDLTGKLMIPISMLTKCLTDLINFLIIP